MGWTGVHREPGLSDRVFFEQELPTTLTTNGRILSCASVGGVFYAVVENGSDAPHHPGTRWMFVAFERRQRGFYNFAYKEMAESSGHFAYRCPRRLLELLEERSPVPPNESAAEWRQGCWENVYRVERAAKFVTRGTVVYFPRPVEFAGGEKLSQLTFEARSTFRRGGRRYRIANWRTDEWSLTPYPLAGTTTT